jgi:hypothetical protein
MIVIIGNKFESNENSFMVDDLNQIWYFRISVTTYIKIITVFYLCKVNTMCIPYIQRSNSRKLI